MKIGGLTYNFYRKHGMSHEQIVSMLPDDWQPYEFNGQYLKTFYDIRTKDGKEYYNQYPNAGMWGNSGIPVTETHEWRLTPQPEQSK